MPLAGLFSIGGVADVARGRLPLAVTIERSLSTPQDGAPDAGRREANDADDADLAKGETESAETESGETESGGDHWASTAFSHHPGLKEAGAIDPHQTFLPEPPFIPTVIPPDGVRA